MTVIPNLPDASIRLVLDDRGLAKQAQVLIGGQVVGQLAGTDVLLELAAYPAPPMLRMSLHRNRYTIEVE